MQKYSASILLDGVNDALRAFASAHTGLASDFTITGDGTTDTFSLPSNIVDSEHAGVYAVQWTNQEWLREERYWPGASYPSTSRSTTSVPRAYVLWPVGEISFTQVPGSGDTITVHYVAHYDDVVDTNSVISIPNWSIEAIKLYAAAVALAPASTKASELGQYKSRREAGKPEDNPLLRLSMHYMDRFYQILSTHPMPQYKLDSMPGDYR
jgi:hypothetical protein